MNKPKIGLVVEKRTHQSVIVEVFRNGKTRRYPQGITSGELNIGDKVYLYNGACRKATPDEIHRYKREIDQIIVSCKKDVKIEW